MDADASDIDGDENSEENELEEGPSNEEIDTSVNKDLDSFESLNPESETDKSVDSESRLKDLRSSALLDEKRWKGIDEKFLSSGLRLLHLLPILSILLIALTRTFRDISPLWWSEFVNQDFKFSIVIGILSIAVLLTYFAGLSITIRKIKSTLKGVKIETDIREIDGQDFRALHGHSSLITTINSVYRQHILTASLVFICIIFLFSSILSSDFLSGGNIWDGTLMTIGTACLLFGYGAHLISLRPSFNTVNPYGLLEIYSPPVHPALLDFPFRDVIGTHIDPILSAKLSDFIHSLSENIIEGKTSIEMQERILHLLYLEQYCGLKKNDLNNALTTILSDKGIERIRGNEDEPWDETWRELIDNSRSRVKPYFRLHDRILHNAMDISDGKRPPGGLWFDIDIENLIEEGEAHLFTFIHNGTSNEKELVVRIQTPDFSPTETHYSLRLPPGSVEKMTASKSSADVKSYMGDLFQESRFIWQTLLPRQTGEATVTVRLEDISGNLLSGKVATVQIQYDMSRRLRWWAGFVSICTGGAAILWLLILPILGFIGGF